MSDKDEVSDEEPFETNYVVSRLLRHIDEEYTINRENPLGDGQYGYCFSFHLKYYTELINYKNDLNRNHI